MTILGTRPEIIRLSLILPKLDKLCEHFILYTGQNYDKNLKDIFFDEFHLRPPDLTIDSRASSFAKQLALILTGVEDAIKSFQPDKVLLLGDTNTDLACIIAEHMGIPVYHMEAGNRCFDLKVPEEKNRRIIDAICTYNMPYTPNSRENLIREGFPKERIYESGNPIFEVIDSFDERIEQSLIMEKLDLSRNNFVLVTAHRQENVDVPERLENILHALCQISDEHHLDVIFSVHPRTKSRIGEDLQSYLTDFPKVRLYEPFGFFDFVRMEKHCLAAITDSGTVQEECCLFNRPVVTIRDTTERPETVECGSNMVSGLEVEDILRCFNIMLSCDTEWTYPIGYADYDVSDRIVKFVLA